MADVVRPSRDDHVRESNFIDNTWVEATSGEAIPVVDCATRERIGIVATSAPAEIDSAVAAASAGTEVLGATPPAARAGYLRALQAELTRRSDELVSLICSEVGTAVRLCLPVQVNSALGMIGAFADSLDTYEFELTAGNSTVVKEPAGPVAAITPWNYPLFQTVNKVAAAIAAGCGVVHKPSELAPLSAFVLAEAVEAAGLPGGAYNLVTGTGATTGEALVSDRRIRVVSFTGSAATGERILEMAAPTMKRVTLELGGKSPSVLLDDADWDTAVRTSVNRAFLNSGQTCDAWTRLLVPEGELPGVEEAIVAAVSRLPLGDPFDPDTRLGPLISDRQLERVRGFVGRAIDDGAQLLVGGVEPPAGFDQGAYFSPTVLVDVRPEMEIAREEVFGPVLCVLTYQTEDEAVDIANGTEYGLSAAVWSADVDRARRVARRIHAGEVVINGGRFNPLAPFGGVGRSGIGREMGTFGIDEFVELKAIQL